jgi:NADPH:quinone reductase-like Zn-dependent oxidoreductase
MPTAERLRDVLTSLVGQDVRVSTTRTVELGGDRVAAIADYHSDAGAVGAVCIADIRLANALGAALTMVSPNVVEDAVAKKVIDDPTIDNFREIVNIMSSLFNCADTPHLKFNEVHKMPSQLPEGTATLLEAPMGRRDYDVTIDTYGTGTLSVLLG